MVIIRERAILWKIFLLVKTQNIICNKYYILGPIAQSGGAIHDMRTGT